MADSDVQITAGSGTKVDTRTVGAGTDEHRQVVVIGDPSTAANVQSVTSAGEGVVGGNVAHDAVDSGNPIKIGGHAHSGVPAQVANNDRASAWFGLNGQLAVRLVAADGTALDTGTAITVDSATAAGITIRGNAAHDASDSSHPIKIGGKANDSAPTQVSANGDRVDGWFDRRGALFTRLTDSSGAAIATGVQYVEDGALGTNGQGTLILGRRTDTLATLTPAVDDAVGLRVNNRGALWTKHDGTMTVDGSGVTQPISAASLPLPTGAATAALQGGGLPSALASDRLKVDGSGVTQPVSGTVTANAGTGSFTVAQATASNLNAQIVGDVAHDAVDSGNPVKIGGKARTSFPTAVANNDRADALFDVFGRQAVSVGDLAAGISDSGVSAETAGLAMQSSSSAAYPLATRPQTYNGSTWDRARSVAVGDGAVATGIPAAGLMGFNGSTWDRVRTANTGRLQVDVVTAPSSATAGDLAHDAVDSGNPVKIGGNASATAPTAVASGDRTNAWFSLNGAQMTSPVAGEGNGADGATGGLWSARGGGTQGSPMPAANYLYNGSTFDRMRGDITNGLDVDVTRMPAPHTAVSLTSVSATYTTAQTSTNLVAGTGGQRIYVTAITISTGGTTAGLLTLYWGTGAFTRGTSPTLFEAEFAPSATARPGATQSYQFPPGGQSATGDNLRITTSANLTCWVTVHYYKA